MADEVVRGVVSLSVTGLNEVKNAASLLDSFSTLNERAASKQAAALDQIAASMQRVAQAQSSLSNSQSIAERVNRAAQAAGLNPALASGQGGYRQRAQGSGGLLGDYGTLPGSFAANLAQRQRQAFQAGERAAIAAEGSARAQADYYQQQLQQFRLATVRSRTSTIPNTGFGSARAAAIANANAANAAAGLPPIPPPPSPQSINAARLGQSPYGQYGYTAGIPGYNGGSGPNGPGGGGIYGRAGGFGDDFGRGFKGLRDRPYAEQLGQTFKFATFYGAAYSILFKLSGAFANATDEAIKFQDAMNSLNIVTGRNTEDNRQLADSLGEVAARSGVSPSEGVAAGARAIGLFGLTGSDQQTQNAAAISATRVATQIALGSGRTFEQIQQDLGAVAQAFNTGYQGQSRIADLDAYITKRYGVTTGNTLETTAQIGTIASQQGFSLSEQTAIAASLQARTGQSPAAVAGFLSQIYGKGTDSRLQGEFQKYGIDTGQTFRDQLSQLSQLNLTADQLNGVADKISKGKAGSAFRALYQDFQRILQTANEAESNGSGASQSQFEQRLNNTAGQIRQFSGAVAEFGKDLLSVGILDFFGAFLVALRTLLNGLDPLLDLFNSLPEPLKLTVVSALALAAAVRILGGSLDKAGANVALGRIASSGPAVTGLVNRANAAGYTVAQNIQTKGLQFIPNGAAVSNFNNGANAATQAAGRLPGAGLGRLAASAAGSELFATLTNPITLAIGGLFALGSIKGSVDSLNESMILGSDALKGIADAVNPEDYKDAANAAQNALKQINDGRSGLFGSIGAFFTPGVDQQAAQLQTKSTFALGAAAAIEDDRKRAAALKQISVFGDPTTRTVESVADALKALEQAGIGAVPRLQLLYDTLTKAGSVAAKQPLARADIAARLAQGLSGLDTVTLNPLFAKDFPNKQQFTTSSIQRAAAARQRNVLVGKDEQIRAAIQEALPAEAAGGVLGPDDIKQVGDSVIKAIGLYESKFPDIAYSIRQYVRDKLKGYQGSGSDPNATLSPEELTANFTENLEPAFQASLGAIQALGNGSKTRALYRQFISKIQGELARTNVNEPDQVSAVTEKLELIKSQYANLLVDDAEKQRKAAQSRAKNKAGIKAAGQTALNAETAALASVGNVDALVTLFEQGNRAMVRVAIGEIRGNLKVAQAAVKAAKLRVAAVSTAGNYSDAALTYALKVQSAAEAETSGIEKAINTALAALAKAAPPAKGGVFETGSDIPGFDSGGASDTAAQIAAARRSAYAVKDGGQIAAARASLATAAADLSAAKKNTVAYYQALGAYFSAQQELADALRQYQTNVLLLRGDITDPLFEAKVRLNEAKKKLATDAARGAGPDVIAQDRVDVKRAQAEAESTAFNQRLQDVQTAERLGRISHTAYLKYLENERRRLLAIANRTRQQQEELDQVDGLIKDAKEAFAGQFNIGDIKLPTPYEVRRYAESVAQGVGYQATAAAAAGPVSGGNVSIQIDGTDTGMVVKILSDYFGPNATARTGTSTKKV